MRKLFLGMVLGLTVFNVQAETVSMEAGLKLDNTDSSLTLFGPRVGASFNFNITDNFTVNPGIRLAKMYGSYKSVKIDTLFGSIGVNFNVDVTERGFVGIGIYRHTGTITASNSYASYSKGYDLASLELEIGINTSKNISISYRPSVEWVVNNDTNGSSSDDNVSLSDIIIHSLNLIYRF